MTDNQDLLNECCERLTVIQAAIQVEMSEEGKAGLFTILEDVKKILSSI